MPTNSSMTLPIYPAYENPTCRSCDLVTRWRSARAYTRANKGKYIGDPTNSYKQPVSFYWKRYQNAARYMRISWTQ